MTFCPNNQLDDLPTRGVTIIGTLNTVLGDLSVRCKPPRFRVQNAEISPMRTMEINAEIIHSDELAASIHLRQYDLTRLDDEDFVEIADSLCDYEYRLAQAITDTWFVEDIAELGTLVDITRIWAAPAYRGTDVMKTSLTWLLERFCANRALTVTFPFPLQYEGNGNRNTAAIRAAVTKLRTYYANTYGMKPAYAAGSDLTLFYTTSHDHLALFAR